MKILDHEQGTQEWLTARLGKITGTRLASVMGTPIKQDDLINELIAEQITEMGDEIRPSPDMLRGIEEEACAKVEYTKRTGTKVTEVGMCIHDKYEWLAYSPDGIIGTKQKYHGGIEIKSPKTKTLVKYVRKGGVPKEYHWQVVDSFIVNEKQDWLDFIIFDPRIRYDELQMVVTRVTRDDLLTDIDIAIEKLLEFRKKWVSEYEKIIF